jgi:hypothetical protein
MICPRPIAEVSGGLTDGTAVAGYGVVKAIPPAPPAGKSTVKVYGNEPEIVNDGAPAVLVAVALGEGVD